MTLRKAILRAYPAILLVAFVLACMLGVGVATFPAIAGLFVMAQAAIGLVGTYATLRVLRWPEFREMHDAR